MLDANEAARRGARQIPAALRAMLRASDGILDLLPIATFICDARGTILQYNQRAVEIWGRVPEPGQTHERFTTGVKFFGIDGKPLGRSGLAQVLATGEPARDVEVIVERADGSRVTVALNIDPLRDAKGEIVGAVNCFLDISERKRVEVALEESRVIAREQEQRLAATYEHAAIGITELAPDGNILRINEAICNITGRSRDELIGHQLFTYTHPDDVDADRDAFRQQVDGRLEFYSIEKRLFRRDGRMIWMSVSSSPVRDAGGQLLYLVRVVQDITERKAAERRNRLLIDELNHRVKNTLATVQSLASQTARGAPSPAEFRGRFEGRLIALSKAHDQLTRHHWESADLRELLSGSLAPYAGAERAVLRGEDVVLRPRAVLTLAMAFHELATNAAKYGALSIYGGKVSVTWTVMIEATRRTLEFDWQESGGPLVRPPAKQGFGSRLLDFVLPGQIQAQSCIDYRPQGVHVQCALPLPADMADGGFPIKGA